MGIRFVCHLCGNALHVKDYQAGKRGKCPNCNGSFRIPDKDSSYSSEIASEPENPTISNIREAFKEVSKLESANDLRKSFGSISTLDASPTKTVGKNIETESSTEAHTNIVSDSAMPLVLAKAGEANWFVRPPSGGQFGPASSRLLMNWIAESRVTFDSYLWREGLAQWQLANELVPELFAKQGATTTVSAVPADAVGQAMDITLDGASTIRASAVLRKRAQKRRQQLTMVILLATISIVLLGILIFVLVFQAAKKPQAFGEQISDRPLPVVQL